MNAPYRAHPSEEALERFLLNTAPEEELETVETHILACGYCVDRLETLETQIAAARLALQRLEAKQNSKSSANAASLRKSWFSIPRLSFATTGVVAAAAAILLSVPQDVTITAYRGTETAIVPEWRPLHMHLNAVQLKPGPVAVELADAEGNVIWKGMSAIRNDSVNVTLPRITTSGDHYVRLYATPQTGSETLLLREFALKTQSAL